MSLNPISMTIIMMMTSSMMSNTLLSKYMVRMQLINESITKMAENNWNLELRMIYLILSLLLR